MFYGVNRIRPLFVLPHILWQILNISGLSIACISFVIQHKNRISLAEILFVGILLIGDVFLHLTSLKVSIQCFLWLRAFELGKIFEDELIGRNEDQSFHQNFLANDPRLFVRPQWDRRRLPVQYWI